MSGNKELALIYTDGTLCGAPHNVPCVATTVMWRPVIGLGEFRPLATLNAT
jgi:hypothetical protein